jgi:hypothetical protein
MLASVVVGAAAGALVGLMGEDDLERGLELEAVEIVVERREMPVLPEFPPACSEQLAAVIDATV